MSVSFYMDEHVHRAIAYGLRLRGVDVLTVQEDGRRGEADPALLDRADELGRVLFTQDQDFLAETARRQAQGEQFTGVVFASQQVVSVGQIVRDLELIAGACEPSDLSDQVIYLPL